MPKVTHCSLTNFSSNARYYHSAFFFPANCLVIVPKNAVACGSSVARSAV